MNRYRMAGLLCLCFVLTLAGCGYTHHTVLPQGIKTIYIETLRNEVPIEQVYAYQPGLEIDITNAIIRRIHRDGNLRVVSREEADVRLECSLIGFEQEGLRFTSLESVREYRLYIVLSMRLVDTKTGNLFWEEGNFTGDAEYFVSLNRTIAREEASRRAIERLAKNVVDRIAEDW